MSSGQLLAGLLRLQRNPRCFWDTFCFDVAQDLCAWQLHSFGTHCRSGVITSGCNSLNELASAGLLALAGPQYCQSRPYADQPSAEVAKPSPPAAGNAAPTSKYVSSMVEKINLPRASWQLQISCIICMGIAHSTAPLPSMYHSKCSITCMHSRLLQCPEIPVRAASKFQKAHVRCVSLHEAYHPADGPS